MKLKKISYGLVLSMLFIVMASVSCKKDSDESPINLFTVDDDIAFGQQVEDEIEAIEEKWMSLGGKEGNIYVDSYNAFKASLP